MKGLGGIVLGLVLLVAVVLFVYMSSPKDACRILQRIPTEHGTIELVDDACQEGLPHTTDAHTVRMTQTVYDSTRREEILVHERIHLAQKRDPQKWEAFYKDAWQYELFSHPPPDLPAELRSALRPNPDTSSKPWALWRGRYLFFPTFRDPPTLRGAKVMVWDTEQKEIVEIPTEWKRAFCGDSCPNQLEHPHEIAAEYRTLGSSSPAASRFFRWLQ